MATVDVTKGAGTTGYPAHLKGGAYRMVKTVDFNANNEGGVNRDADDVLQLIDIPAMSLVVNVGIVVETVEGGTLTFDVGDGDDVDGYVDGANGNAAAGALAAAAGFSGQKYYAAADTIDMTVLNDADAAKITVVAIVLDLSAAA